MSIGQSLESIRKDLKLMPTPTLMQYKQNPGKKAFDGVPMDMLAGLELSRRAQLQQEQLAKTAPNPQQMPTVVDQAAQQLSGMPPQGMPQPQGAPQQAPQFASAPPQQAPQQPQQQPPQQMAQAPQAPQPPMQPTQQPPQKLAAGGIATLGDMEQQETAQQYGLASMMPNTGAIAQPQMAPQGNPLMTNNDSPVVRMATGGIVAFVNNENQPVDADMPASDEDLTRPATVNPNLLRQGQKARENRGATRFEDERARNMQEVLNASTPAPDSYRRGDPRAKPMTREEAGLPPEGAGDIQITQTEDPMAKLYDLIAAGTKGGGGGGGMSPEVKNAIKEGNDILAESRVLKNPEITESDRERIIEAQFKKNQAASKPVFDQQSALLQEAKDAAARRREAAASNARLRFGLGLLGSNSPTLGGGIKESALPALDAYDRAAELADVADEKNRAAEMDLARSRLADEKNDRKSAQEYFDSYQRNKREAYAAQVQALQLRASAAKMPADLSLHQQQINAQGENAGLRSQVQMLGVLRNLENDKTKNARAGMPTIADTVRLNTYLDQRYGPSGPGTMEALARDPQTMALLKNKTITIDNPKVQQIIKNAREAEARGIKLNSRTSGGGTSASDLEGSLGLN